MQQPVVMQNPAAIQNPTAAENSLAKKSFVKRFFAFDEFITARVLKIVYILGSVLIVLYTIGLLAIGLYAGFDSLSKNFHIEKFPGILGNLLFFIAQGLLALLALRLYCEFMMVIFKIYESLQAGRNRNVQI